MKGYSLLVFLFSFAFSALAQPAVTDRYTDSVLLLLKGKVTDSVKAESSYKLSEYWVLKDTLKARQYLEQGHTYAKGSTYLQSAYYYYAGYFLAKVYPEQGEAMLLKADTLLSRFSRREAYRLRARAWHNYAVLRQHQDDHKDFATIVLNKAIPLARKAGDSVYIARNYLNLCIVFKNHQEYGKAAIYCQMAIDGYKQAHADPEMIIIAYYTLAENYSLWNKADKATPMLDSARAWLQPYPDSEEWIGYYAAAGMNYTIQSKFAAAMQSLESGVQLARRLGKKYDEQRLIMQQFYAYYNQQEFAKALKAVQFLLLQPEIMTLAVNRVQLYYGIAETYAAMGRMQPAYTWFKRYSQLSDSVYESRLKTDIQAMEVKFRTAENRQKIASLEADKQQATLSARNTRLTIGLLSAVILVLLLLAGFVSVSYRKDKQLSAQREINYQQQLREMSQQQQLVATRAMLEGEERERSRLSRDLHDGLGGMLAGIKMKLARRAADMGKGEYHSSLDDTLLQLDQSVDELRRIARNLMPESLLKFGLKTALADLCELMSNGHTQIDFQYLAEEDMLPLPAQVNIYRIVQELLNNAMRHADASSILLQCSQYEQRFFITVEDNGKGFDVDGVQRKPGVGLTSMRYRVDYLRGKMNIQSVRQTGTTIDIELTIPAAVLA